MIKIFGRIYKKLAVLIVLEERNYCSLNTNNVILALSFPPTWYLVSNCSYPQV